MLDEFKDITTHCIVQNTLLERQLLICNLYIWAFLFWRFNFDLKLGHSLGKYSTLNISHIPSSINLSAYKFCMYL